MDEPPTIVSPSKNLPVFRDTLSRVSPITVTVPAADTEVPELKSLTTAVTPELCPVTVSL